MNEPQENLNFAADGVRTGTPSPDRQTSLALPLAAGCIGATDRPGATSFEERAPAPALVRPTTLRLAYLERLRQPTVAQLEEREFLREQVSLASRGDLDRPLPLAPLQPLPKQ